MKRRLLALFLALLLACGTAAWLFHRSWQTLHRPFQGYAESERVVMVERGAGAGKILDRLEAEGVVADARLARAYLVYALEGPPLRAGEYRFEGPATTPEVLDKLIRGEVLTYAVTIVEGLTLEETAAHLAAEGFGSEEEFLRRMRSPEAISDLDPDAADLEGYLFPDTYSFARGTPEGEIVSTLVATFRRGFQAEIQDDVEVRGKVEAEVKGKTLPTPVEDRRPTLRELVTLASVVEKEARLDEERPTIAGVYRNRLDRGIALYADPTVIFALKREGRWDGNLRRSDLRMESPYNTYRYPGLPPGPICSPGLASLKAAAVPAEVPFLYFVSRNDGSHVFAETLREHNRNVETWQRKYWHDRWARERALNEAPSKR